MSIVRDEFGGTALVSVKGPNKKEITSERRSTSWKGCQAMALLNIGERI